jgi:opacity protein-like surface antigen
MAFNRPMSAEVMSHYVAEDRASVSRLSIGYTTLIGANVVAGLQFETGGYRSPGVIGQPAQDGRDSASAVVRIEQGPSYTLAARIGYLPNPQTQFYALAGYSRIATSAEVTMMRDGVSVRAASNDFTIEGTTFGLGVETRIGQGNSVGIEVRNTGFRSRGLLRGTAAENTPSDAVLDSDNQSILLTFTHRF